MDNAALLSNLYNMQTQYSLNTASLDLEIPRCIINSNSRAITIPEEIKFFGVQYDHRSTSVFFEIDRIVDDVDLSTQTCVVQWINGDLTTGNMGFFPVTNVDTSIPDKLVFEWEIYNESTQLTGDLHFSIRFYSMMDEKTFLYSYNTLPARSIILDTLDVQMTSTIEIKPSALEIWTERVSQLEIVARESIEISKRSAFEAEAWAHGRNDHPNTILDNALYYKNLTAAIYQEAKGSVELEKEVVVAEIADAKNQSISEIQAITDNSVRTAQQTGEEIEQNVLQYGVVQVSEMPPESDHVQVWIQPNESEEYSLPEIKDDEINEVDTWSSHKIKTELDKNDITQLKSDLNELSNTKSGAIIQTASGESIVTNDSSNDPFRGLRVFGKTEQQTYSGKNLFNPENVIQGYFSIGDATSLAAAAETTSIWCECEPNTTYTVSKTLGARFYIGYTTEVPALGVSVTYIANTESQTSLSYTSGDEATYLVAYVHHTTHDTISLEEMLSSVQIEKSDTATEYEPYTGGIPSPNPQYPQELVSIGDDGDVEVSVHGGKNLFDETLLTEENCEKWFHIKLKPNTKYTFSTNLSKNDSSGSALLFFLSGIKNDGASSGANGVFKENPITQTADSDGYVSVIFRKLGGTNIPSNFYWQLEEGTKVTAYEPHKKQTLTALTPNGLPGIKVTDASIATYTDANGQTWCADEIDFERGVYVKRITHLTITSESNGAEYGMCDNGVTLQFPIGYEWLSASVVMCDMFPKNSTHNWNAYNNTVWLGSANRHCVQISVSSEIATSMAGFRTWLGDRVINAMAAIKEPIETPLTADELAQYRALHSNYPVTTVMNDSGANMEVKYNADTKSYIDNKFAELQTALVALGGI